MQTVRKIKYVDEEIYVRSILPWASPELSHQRGHENIKYEILGDLILNVH